jgi:hypothetical protein
MAIRNGWYLLARPASNLSCSNPSSRRYLYWADWVSLGAFSVLLFLRPTTSPTAALLFVFLHSSRSRVFLVGSGVSFPFRGSIRHLKTYPLPTLLRLLHTKQLRLAVIGSVCTLSTQTSERYLHTYATTGSCRSAALGRSKTWGSCNRFALPISSL